ncbi:hypothetical protein [Caballeronia sp. BCC1704]|uniref:hypothetical protein n=1 Tax=Caballeronia sp. BCC1704 TaxID=2676300 RepID=UPI00158BA089|nr:hypothetical protein [Caballeronia sp. BCC1704]
MESFELVRRRFAARGSSNDARRAGDKGVRQRSGRSGGRANRYCTAGPDRRFRRLVL